jgi:signal transduction histidine kinase
MNYDRAIKWIDDRIVRLQIATDTDEGTGMGLSVVHSIVKSHGGAIKVYSELGKGSSFNVNWPRRIESE